MADELQKNNAPETTPEPPVAPPVLLNKSAMPPEPPGGTPPGVGAASPIPELPLSSPIETMQQALERTGHGTPETKKTLFHPSIPVPPPPPIATPTIPAATLAGSSVPTGSPKSGEVLQPAGAPPPPAAKPIPPPPPAPPKPQAAPTPQPVPHVDLSQVILPQKQSGPSPLSAQRVNAGAVLEAAQAPMPHTAPKLDNPILPAKTEYAREEIHAVHTFKTDVEEGMQKENISLASIAASQAKADRSEQEESPKTRINGALVLEVGGGIIFALAAVGLIVFAWMQIKMPAQSQGPSVPFIYVDATDNISVPTGETRSELLQTLSGDSTNLALSVGLMERFYLTTPATSSAAGQEMDAQQFLGLIAPDAPPALPLALGTPFLLGVYAFDGNQPFLIFKTDPSSYDQAFAAMLAWEPTMFSDLSPLFTLPQTPGAEPSTNVATTTATTTRQVASSTPPETPSSSQILTTPFSDDIVDNHDARVLKDAGGNIILLWSFLDRSTLVITTNEDTLQEIDSRLTGATTVPTSGQ